MNIMNVFAAALTASMLSSAIASASTVTQPRSSNQFNLGVATSASMTTSDMPNTQAILVAGDRARQMTKPLAFAQFGQGDEAASEN